MIQSVKEEREFLQGVQEDLREDRRHNPVPSIYGVWDVQLEETELSPVESVDCAAA